MQLSKTLALLGYGYVEVECKWAEWVEKFGRYQFEFTHSSVGGMIGVRWYFLALRSTIMVKWSINHDVKNRRRLDLIRDPHRDNSGAKC